ncbi:MAG TPA: MCE family protein [Streptosporangiaceae bacterium]|nr:MCE family protein [Streptosporangiaceae bacterium]
MITMNWWRAKVRPGRLLRTKRDRWVLSIAAAIVAAGLIIPGVLLYGAAHPAKHVTAYFAETIGVYPGSSVRVLGVQVGTVNSVQPDGTGVRVTMTLDPGIAVPADADAVVVAPSVVSDRYVQLTPAYTRGPQLGDGAVIPVSRTAIPVEVDQIYAALTKLANALGPNGANSHGALSELIKTGAANLSGNGSYLRQMITEFSGLSRALGGSAGDLFASVANLQSFTTMLKTNNGQVKLAERQLAEVSSFLAADRQDLSGAIRELAVALGQVKSFIGGNRSLLVANISKLAAITSLLSRERASLAEALDTAPLAADNLVNAYDAAHRTLDGRGDLNELSIKNAAAASTTADLQPDSAGGPPGSVPVLGTAPSSLPPLPLPAVGPVYSTPQALLRSSR